MRSSKLYQHLIGSLVLAFFMMAFASPVMVRAADKGSITLYYGDDVTEQAEVLLYRVGELDYQGDIILEKKYAAYQVNLDDRNAAQLLRSYLLRDGLEANDQSKLDEEGKAVFTELEDGVYLVIADEVMADGFIYQPFASLVSLPYADKNGNPDRNLVIQGKCEKTPISDYTSLFVRKVWQDSDNEISRPQSITVQLLKDNEVVEEVELSKDGNNWSYYWEELDGAAVWSVAEKNVPAGYHVSLSRKGEEFYIINTKDEQVPPVLPPRLPQTGQLWWPVMPMICMGLLLIIIGALIRRDNSDV